MRKDPSRALTGYLPRPWPPAPEGSVGHGWTDDRRRLIADLWGVGLLAALAGWIVVSAVVAGGDPGPVVALVVLSGVSLFAARSAGGLSRSIVPSLVVATAALVALFSLDELVGSGPLGGPFGYANATGAFYLQASMAGLMLATGPRRSIRPTGWVAAIAFAGVVVASGSLAATALLLGLGATSLVVIVARRTRTLVTVAASLLGLATVLTVGVGATYEPDSGVLDRAAEATVGERRAVLWSDAVEIIAEDPVVGAGPGSFPLESPTARADADARWAHNEFLEIGAESGIPAAVLLGLVFAWAFLRIGLASPGAAIALGAAALVALGVHSTIDYVMHFPAIPITTAALVGTAAAGGRERWA